MVRVVRAPVAMRRLLPPLVALLLAACGQPGGLPTPHPAALPAGELGCFRNLRAVPLATAPSLAQAEAEARARQASRGGPRQLDTLLGAQAVTVQAGEGSPGLLGGRDVWLLTFASSPAPAWPASPVPAGPSRTYALVDARDGSGWGTCTEGA